MKVKNFRIDLVRENNEPCGAITRVTTKKASYKNGAFSCGKKKKHGGLKLSPALEKESPLGTQEAIRQLTCKFLDDLSQLLKDL